MYLKNQTFDRCADRLIAEWQGDLMDGEREPAIRQFIVQTIAEYRANPRTRRPIDPGSLGRAARWFDKVNCKPALGREHVNAIVAHEGAAAWN